MQGWKTFAIFLVVTATAWAAATTSGITASPATLEFAYQVRDAALPASKNVSVNATGTFTGSQLRVDVTASPPGWLTVTPDLGRAPLTLSVSANPTGLAPGSYSGLITVDTVPPSSNPAVVNVTLSVRNPPARLNVSSTASNYTTPPPSLTFNYTTGSANVVPASAVLNVASSGDTVPFTVTAAGSASSGGKSGGSSAVWPRVNGANQLPSTKTSGVALAGSSVPITVTVDPVVLGTLDPGSYSGTITTAANSAANGTAMVAVTLVVSAGAPSVTSVFPAMVVAGPAVDPTITINGDNFFATSVVTLEQVGATTPPITLTATLLSRKVLRAVIPSSSLASPGSFLVAVTNPPPPSNPSQLPAKIAFSVVSATQPAMSSIANSASFMPAAIYTGTSPNPVPSSSTTVSPRELITIFGQNLGPDTPSLASPSGTPSVFPASLDGVSVRFVIGGMSFAAPLIMVSSNQINAIVPKEVATVVANPDPGNRVTIVVDNNGVLTPAFTAIALDYNPGVFTFDGLGKGQAAVLNYDVATTSYVVNSSKDTAGKNSTIIIYATGLGELADASVANGQVAAAATNLLANTVRVDIDGQPAVVIYAGTTPGAVAGLAQINAIVPPTVKTGGAIPVAVSAGPATSSRKSQTAVTIGVK